ncbi:GDSL-type esterase/lipase family protein [Sphingobacterium sp. UT-1RO-CII-1]|uniref:GDSL-type esterase/lipase family protein n=1 Tax=Sphingobacterium sp. UT-1RO-CII-1 TaxID=2995225 RepID=UPI00227B7B80|nr:GDSL-type esterase/lipase family protein [Sphingobacterium sp. UT-1RO-CII-1]MCY4781217.1 GDSL-type esterase/lipase family protein [Sphingobacterium sp. UT-1RO-CII-1]
MFYLIVYTAAAQGVKQVVCFGQNITLGGTMFMPDKNNYPAQLAAMLNETVQVSVNGKKLEEYSSMVSASELAESIWTFPAEKGDMLLVEWTKELADLATAPENENRVKQLLRSLLERGVRFGLLWTGLYQVEPTNLQIEKQKMLDLAFDSGLEVLDVGSLLATDDVLMTADKELTSIGASAIAKRVYEHVQTPLKAERTYVYPEAKRTNFNGYVGSSFKFKGRDAIVVAPKLVAEGKPWVWRARFWGHEPQFDIAMLERGYHVVYCDVAELFGNEESNALWNDFYGMLQGKGFAEKAVMEGMSRGGMYVYNWLLKYPERVAAVYADAPVLDPRSWPGGKGAGKGSPSDWELFKKVYGLTEVEALTYKKTPLERAAEVARTRVPLIHVVGDVDDVVPVAENSGIFEQRIKAAKGDITIVHKAHIGHHPHSLPNPQLIVDFILRAESRKINFAKIAAPGAEYRVGAGWKEGAGWWGQHADIDSLLLEKEGQLDVLFVGNSITQGLGGNRSKLAYKPAAKEIFEQQLHGYTWESAGIAGDRTQHVFWRLKNGKYKNAKPKAIVLTIGVNNFLDGDSAEEIAEAIMDIHNWVLEEMPHTKLFLTGPLPVGLSVEDPRRKKYDAIQEILKESVKGTKAIYIPMTDVFIQDDGTIALEDYSKDGIHLNTEGYRKWAVAIGQILKTKK